MIILGLMSGLMILCGLLVLIANVVRSRTLRQLTPSAFPEMKEEDALNVVRLVGQHVERGYGVCAAFVVSAALIAGIGAIGAFLGFILVMVATTGSQRSASKAKVILRSYELDWRSLKRRASTAGTE